MKLLKVFLLLTIVAAFASCGRNANNGNGQANAFYANYINAKNGIYAKEDLLLLSNVPGAGNTNGFSQFSNGQDYQFKAIIDLNGSFKIIVEGETISGGYTYIEYFTSTWSIQGNQLIIDNFGASIANGSFGNNLSVDTTHVVRLTPSVGGINSTTIPKGTRVTLQYGLYN